jgi:hypothetical protein
MFVCREPGVFVVIIIIIIIYFKLGFYQLVRLKDYSPIVFSVVQRFFAPLAGNSQLFGGGGAVFNNPFSRHDSSPVFGGKFWDCILNSTWTSFTGFCEHGNEPSGSIKCC